MELAALDTVTLAEEGVEFEVMHPKLGATGVFVKMLGADSRQYKAALREVAKKMTPDTTAQDMETELAIRCTTGWRGIDENGEAMRFSDANLRKVYAAAPIVREQSIAFMRDRGTTFASRVQELKEAARNFARLNLPNKDGQTRKQTLESVERQTGHRDPELDSVHVPKDCEQIWQEYFRIRRGRTIEWRDLADYQTVTGVKFSGFEVDAILAMDTAIDEVIAEVAKRKEK